MKVAVRPVVLLTGVVLALTACSGGDGSKKDEATPKKAPAIVLPSDAPAATGLPTGPALEPVALVKASDQLDDQTGRSVEALVAERTSGAVVTDDVVVGYTVSNVSGYDPKTGKKRWTAGLDMGTGTTCSVSQPDTTSITTFTVLYGAEGSCDHLATVSVKDGKVLSNVDLGQLGAEDESGRMPHSVDDEILTFGTTDHLVAKVGRSEDVGVYAVEDGKPVLKATLGTDVTYVNPAATAPVLVVATGDDAAGDTACTISGFALPSFEKTWTVGYDTVFPDAIDDDCPLALAPQDGSWVYVEGGVTSSIAQLDAMTGQVIGTLTQDDGVEEGAAAEPSLYALSVNQMVALDGDLVIPQVRGIVRYSMSGDKIVWRFDGNETLVDGVPEDDRYQVTFVPKSVTADGRYVIATASAASSVEVFALDAETGAVVGRWPVPEKYRTGLTLDPIVAPFAGGIALIRNFREDLTAEIAGDAPGADGSQVYDIGLFTWPKQK
jgi:hypothetical protein